MLLPQSSISQSLRWSGKVSGMNTKHYFGRFIAAPAGTTAIIMALALAPSGRAQDKTTRERIGIYDSRAIAVAYAGSTAQVQKMKELTAQMKEALEAADTNRVAQLEREGRAWQTQLQQQGFGTAPVDALFANIARELPAIQEAAGVTTLISKWNKTELDRHPRAEQVDITMRLVDAFHPNEKQRKRALEIQKMKPQKIKD